MLSFIYAEFHLCRMSFMLNIINLPSKLSVIMPNVFYTECQYAECQYAECRFDECRGPVKTHEIPTHLSTLKLQK